MALALHTAAREGNLQELKELLDSGCGIDNRDKHSRTALHMAAWAGQVACVDFLLKAGANIHVAAMDDMSSLHFAAQQGHLEVCRSLINAGLKVNSKTRKGTNALHFAAKKGHVDLVRYLIKRRAKVSATDRNGKTALDLASDEAVKAVLQEALDSAQQAEVAGPSEAVKTADTAEAPPDASGDDEGTTAVPIGPQEQPPPVEKKERGNIRKRNEPQGEEPADAAEEPAPKRVQKVALSFLGDDGEDEENG